ncbi:hypothetical protein [Pyrococcus yayanosii]|uniref:hypothetical protein n=1 Tax=Pyrococcus yayanosii TaxID=1008460 RepID=UPI0011D1A27E|nr:hypothetical protein [Pyrococcus yayanosii]
MRKLLPFLILILQCSAGLSLGAPYWIEPGVYMKYVTYQTKPVNATSPGFGDATLILLYNYSGKLFEIGAFGNSTVTFTISFMP